MIPFGKSHNWADPEIPKDFDLKINLSPRLGGVERKTFFLEIVNIPILSCETLRNSIFATVFEKSKKAQFLALKCFFLVELIQFSKPPLYSPVHQGNRATLIGHNDPQWQYTV